MNISDVISVIESAGIRCIKDGYTTLPADHCFAVWRKAKRWAKGADGYALYWAVTYELRIFYRDRKTVADMTAERALEAEIRECDNLESEYEYDPDSKLDITVYRFDGTEEF